MKILVTGGAGYIGSHTVHQLKEAGKEVVVIDNLSTGRRWAIPEGVPLVEGCAGDAALVEKTITAHRIGAVIHFAGSIIVDESVRIPLEYYRNNSMVSHSLLSTCRKAGVKKFIFSSTAAVYGSPKEVPVREGAPTQPINPYGSSKLVTEWMLRDLAQSEAGSEGQAPFTYVALRYFNVAGARLDGKLGQSTPQATHLIKVACQAATGQRPSVSIFGTDFPTPDGTGIRDYIHVEDLARAHLDALAYLEKNRVSRTLNCGYGEGSSVRQVLAMVKKTSGVDFKVVETSRRAGDPAMLVADGSEIRKVLGWTPRYQDLEVICRTAFEWEKNLLKRAPAKLAGSDR